MGVLELFIGGLIPNRCYTACVSSVDHCGCESAPSGWSAWLTLQPVQPVACVLPHGGFQVPTMQMGQPLVMPQLVPPSPQAVPCQVGEPPSTQPEADLKKMSLNMM